MQNDPNDRRRTLNEKKRRLIDEKERIERSLQEVITDSEVRNRMKNRINDIDYELRRLDDQMRRL